ncbi:hypothetical protein WJX74_005552 [Apatococcus lobatus]|uniref:Uncharacterized protein n=1 Tax=Apatococcus lobatus TaxID=904363 RepID=A0AAW1QZL8_9CHLO
MASGHPTFPQLSYPFRAEEFKDALPGYCEAIRGTYQNFALLRASGQMDPEKSLIQVFLILPLHKGKLVTENSVGLRVSVLPLPMPVSAIQAMVDESACHAALVSGEVRLGDLHGIILQVSTQDHASSYCRSHVSLLQPLSPQATSMIRCDGAHRQQPECGMKHTRGRLQNRPGLTTLSCFRWSAAEPSWCLNCKEHCHRCHGKRKGKRG